MILTNRLGVLEYMIYLPTSFLLNFFPILLNFFAFQYIFLNLINLITNLITLSSNIIYLFFAKFLSHLSIKYSKLSFEVFVSLSLILTLTFWIRVAIFFESWHSFRIYLIITLICLGKQFLNWLVFLLIELKKLILKIFIFSFLSI